MAYNFKATDVMSGSFGKLYIDGREIAEIESFEAKADLKGKDVLLANGEIRNKNVGISIEIKFKVQKVFSLELDLLKSVSKGKLNPLATLNVQIDDPEAVGSEAVAFNECGFKGNFDILSFTRQELVGREFTLSCGPSDIEILESVDYL